MKTQPYPQMSEQDFRTWISEVLERFSDTDPDFTLDQMVNDEVSGDEELQAYLISNDVNPEFVAELIPMRAYFWDFRYSQNITL